MAIFLMTTWPEFSKITFSYEILIHLLELQDFWSCEQLLKWPSEGLKEADNTYLMIKYKINCPVFRENSCSSTFFSNCSQLLCPLKKNNILQWVHWIYLKLCHTTVTCNNGGQQLLNIINTFTKHWLLVFIE